MYCSITHSDPHQGISTKPGYNLAPPAGSFSEAKALAYRRKKLERSPWPIGMTRFVEGVAVYAYASDTYYLYAPSDRAFLGYPAGNHFSRRYGMSQSISSLAIRSATRYVCDPRPSPGELVGGVLGSSFGPVGAMVGGTLGRMVESHLSE